jgi:3-oxoacyl-[acyl-carrier protein] reductase
VLDGRHVAVTGGDAGVGRDIVLGLEDLGASVTAVAERELDAVAGLVDVVLHAAIDPAALERQPLVETVAEDWDRRCEAVLRSALSCSQSAYRLLHDGGGLLVFVTPTLGITGAAQLVPYATAIEGIRAMAKSAARQWGQQGIRVNCVAPSAELLAPGAGTLSPDVAEPALGAVPTDAGALVSAISLLAGPGSVVTGATIVVDGGMVMVP